MTDLDSPSVASVPPAPSASEEPEPLVVGTRFAAILRDPEFVNFGIWIDLLHRRDSILPMRFSDVGDSTRVRQALCSLMNYLIYAYQDRTREDKTAVVEISSSEFVSYRRILNAMNPEVLNLLHDAEYVRCFLHTLALHQIVSYVQEFTHSGGVYEDDLYEYYRHVLSSSTLYAVSSKLKAFIGKHARTVKLHYKSEYFATLAERTLKTLQTNTDEEEEAAMLDVDGVDATSSFVGDVIELSPVSTHVSAPSEVKLSTAANLRSVDKDRDDIDGYDDDALSEESESESDDDDIMELPPAQSFVPMTQGVMLSSAFPLDGRDAVSRMHPSFAEKYKNDLDALVLAAACVDTVRTLPPFRNEALDSERLMFMVESVIKKKRGDPEFMRSVTTVHGSGLSGMSGTSMCA